MACSAGGGLVGAAAAASAAAAAVTSSVVAVAAPITIAAAAALAPAAPAAASAAAGWGRLRWAVGEQPYHTGTAAEYLWTGTDGLAASNRPRGVRDMYKAIAADEVRCEWSVERSPLGKGHRCRQDLPSLRLFFPGPSVLALVPRCCVPVGVCTLEREERGDASLHLPIFAAAPASSGQPQALVPPLVPAVALSDSLCPRSLTLLALAL